MSALVRGPMNAAEQFSRIVSLVASLTRRANRDGDDDVALGDLAREFGVTESAITADIRTLTLLGEHADATWLLSLRVLQQDDRVSISSAGPFRRPVQLSPEERLAIEVALLLDPAGAPLAKRFASHWAGRGAGAPAERAPDSDWSDVIRQAARETLELKFSHAGEGDRSPNEWVVEPHQVVEAFGRNYLVAWAPSVNQWRRFRLDRVLSADLTGRTFTRRTDFKPVDKTADVFQPNESMDRVTVRFSPRVAALVAERYPEHERLSDGHVLVAFTSSSPEWLVRTILEYGADAEVIEPAPYRDAILAAVA